MPCDRWHVLSDWWSWFLPPLHFWLNDVFANSSVATAAFALVVHSALFVATCRRRCPLPSSPTSHAFVPVVCWLLWGSRRRWWHCHCHDECGVVNDAAAAKYDCVHADKRFNLSMSTAPPPPLRQRIKGLQQRTSLVNGVVMVAGSNDNLLRWRAAGGEKATQSYNSWCLFKGKRLLAHPGQEGWPVIKSHFCFSQFNKSCCYLIIDTSNE